MKVTAIITVRNRTLYLHKCLVSLSKQSLVVDEVIVTDDGSEEDIRGFLLSISETLPFSIKYVRQEYLGFRVARARNNAIKIATGDLLIFLDSDIISTKNYIEIFRKTISSASFISAYPIRLTIEQTRMLSLEQISSFDFSTIISNKQKFKIFKQYINDNLYSFANKFISNYKRKHPKLRGGVSAVLRDDIFKINGYDEKFIGWGNEDDNLGFRLYSNGCNGKNPFLFDYPIHLYHEPHHNNGLRVNAKYVADAKYFAKHNNNKCEFGLDNQFQKDTIFVDTIK